MAPDVCPNCGAPVPVGAKACPECGSDDETGWSDTAPADNLGLPDESFDHGDFVKREFGTTGPRPRGISWFWWVIAVVVVVAFLLLWVK